MDAVTPPTSLRGSQVCLRRMQDYDAARLFDIIDRDRHHLGRFLPWPPKIRTLEDELKFVRTMTGAWDEQSAFCYCVAPTVEADVVGVITAFSFSWHDECVELGYWLGSDSVGHGYATGAVRLLERALFDGAPVGRPTRVRIPLGELRFPPNDLRKASGQQTLLLAAALEATARAHRGLPGGGPARLPRSPAGRADQGGR